jgi:hypothetical protein
MTAEQQLADLQANMDIALGRLNAVHAGLYVIAKHLPRESLGSVVKELEQATEAIHADAIASPLPDRMLDEMQRVLSELQMVLRATKDQTGFDQPRPT